ncbi:MAG: hypothetical protein N2376_05945 [Clostridia bacterium]|nr:hypothetical protein [Clostridia bacterium]
MARDDEIKERHPFMRAFFFLCIGAFSLLLVGCEQKTKWELVTTNDGVAYRINKKNGDVFRVTGLEIVKLKEIDKRETDAIKKSYVRDWPVKTIKNIGVVSLHLKTTWRDGELKYLLNVSPITSQVQKAIETKDSEARFNLDFSDKDGFELLTLTIKLQEMTRIIDDTGKPQSLIATGSKRCSVKTYEEIALFGIGWAGFPEESP